MIVNSCLIHGDSWWLIDGFMAVDGESGLNDGYSWWLIDG